jgi:regulator of protease activity HflC (stomatin/prohibitin superfamily)
MIAERNRNGLPGIPMLVLLLAIIVACGWLIRHAVQVRGFVLVGVVALFFLRGLFTVSPNQGRVLQLFGAYRGTARTPGLRWSNPFFTRKPISLRVRNFETARLKVNDNRGNPIEIAAVVVWKVVETAEAAFQVDDYENYVHVQSEAALRNLATGYPYDAHKDEEIALSSHTAEVSAQLKTEIRDRLEKAGVEVIETRVTHLAYAQEIAAVMLRRQQAAAVVAARRTIVEGAVGMVESALEMLAQQKVVELDEERKATMVSNLLVVLCSEQNTQPVINTGSLYR